MPELSTPLFGGIFVLHHIVGKRRNSPLNSRTWRLSLNMQLIKITMLQGTAGNKQFPYTIRLAGIRIRILRAEAIPAGSQPYFTSMWHKFTQSPTSLSRGVYYRVNSKPKVQIGVVPQCSELAANTGQFTGKAVPASQKKGLPIGKFWIFKRILGYHVHHLIRLSVKNFGPMST